MKGVLSVIVGYSGGKKQNPNYNNIMDHTETIRVEYDTSVLSYEDLLAAFLMLQDGGPRSKSWSRQYRSVLLPHSPQQRQAAEAFMKQEQERQNRKLYVDIQDGGDFYRAEEYHQKYIEKQSARFSR